MKFTVQSKLLQEALKRIKLQGRTTTLPVLCCVKIEAVEGSISLYTTNLNQSFLCHVQAEVEGPGCCCIDLDRLEGFPSSNDLSVKLDGSKATLRSGRLRANIQTLPGSEMPNAPEVSDEADVSFDYEVPQGLTDSLSWAQSTLPPVAMDAFCQGLVVGEDQILGTDRNSFHVCETGIPGIGQIIVPLEALRPFRTLMDNPTRTVRISLHQGILVLDADGTTFATRLVHGSIPDFKVFLKRFAASEDIIRCDAQQLANAVYRCADVTKSHCAALKSDGDGVIQVSCSYGGAYAVEKIDGSFNAPFEIGLSPLRTAKAFKVFNGEIEIRRTESAIYISDGKNSAGIGLMKIN